MSKKSLLVENGGWKLKVIDQGDALSFIISYQDHNVSWQMSKNNPKCSDLMTHIEQVLGREPLPHSNRSVWLSNNVEWCIYVEPEEEKYPFCLWHTHKRGSSDHSFHQLTRGEIYLTKEEVETLHHILKGD